MSTSSSEQTKVISAYEYANTFKKAINKMCIKRLSMGKVIDEETPGVRKVYHGCADEVLNEVAMAVWASYGDEIEVRLDHESKKWKAVDAAISLLAKRTANKFIMREYRIQSNISFTGVEEVIEQQEQDFTDCDFFDKLDSALLVEDMLSYMPEETAKIMVMYHDLNNSLRGISQQLGIHRSTVIKRLEQGANIAKHYMHREEDETYRPWTEYHKRGQKREDVEADGEEEKTC